MIKLKNIHTGEVRWFKTLQEAADNLYCSLGAVKLLSSGKTKTLGGRWKKYTYTPRRKK